MAMELEHMLQQTNVFLMFQMIFLGSLMVPSMIGRIDLYGKIARVLASNVVSFGPFGILVYVLYHVSHLR
jgi:hypothetical protein